MTEPVKTEPAATEPGTTEPVKIQIWSDYVCPFCMLAEDPLEEATKDLDVEIEWKPFELRPDPQPTLRPEDAYLPDIWRRVVYPMARSMDVDITLPTVSPQPYTRLAFEGHQYAAEQGKGTEYTRRMFRAFFQEDLDIGRADVLTALARDIGLDADDFRAALDNGTYRDTHQQALDEGAARRIRSVPTLFVGGTRIEGVPRASQLRAAILAAQDEQTVVAGTACRIDGC